MRKFEVGKTYTTRSACDHECIFEYTVIARTPKTLRLKSGNKYITKKVYVYDGSEYCKPEGNYSMAPVIRA